LDIFNAGECIEKFEVGVFVCTSKGCITKSRFNAEFLSASYPDDIFLHLLQAKPIFGGKNLTQTADGFEQKIQTKEYNIIYKVGKKKLYFKDRKNKILIKLKDING